MPQYLLGLDLGSYSIKGAVFETTFRSYQLTDLFESPPIKADELAAEERVVVIREAVLRLIEENHLQPATVVTAIPGGEVSTRVISLPLSEKQVEKVLPFELESQLPFDLDEIIVTSQTIAANKMNTLLLAAAVRKSTLAEHLALVRGAGLEPAFIGLDSLAFYSLNQMNLFQDSGTYAIVDIGHQKTSICIVSNHHIRYVRTLMVAGKAVTEAIRSGLDMTWDQSMEVKHDHGILEMEGQSLKSKDLRRLSAAIKSAIDPLLREINQTTRAYRAHYSNLEKETPAVERLYLSGGGSLLRNLPEYVASLSALPTERLHFFPKDHEVSKRLGEREPVLAQAVALGLRVAARGRSARQVATLNFRKGDFAFARDLSDLKRKVFFFGRWAAAIFAVALLHVGLQYRNHRTHLKQIQQQVIQSYLELVPDAKTPPSSSDLTLKLIQGRIAENREKLGVITKGLNEMTALGILREVSQLLSADIPVDTQELSIDRNQITFRANTQSFAAVDRIIADLKKNPQFQKIDKGDIRDSTDGRKSFQLIVTVGDTENPPVGGSK